MQEAVRESSRVWPDTLLAAVLLFLGELLFAFLPTAFRRAKACTAFCVAFFLWRKRNDRNSISTFLNYNLISHCKEKI